MVYCKMLKTCNFIEICKEKKSTHNLIGKLRSGSKKQQWDGFNIAKFCGFKVQYYCNFNSQTQYTSIPIKWDTIVSLYDRYSQALVSEF